MKKLPRLIRNLYPLFKFSLKMKFSTLLLLATLFSMQANETFGQRNKITLNLNGVTVGRLIDEIEGSTEFEFVYRLDDVDLERTVSVRVKKESITTVLDLVFQNTRTTYNLTDNRVYLVKRKKAVINLDTMNTTPKSFLQHSVSGSVTDSSGQPLPGASIVEKGTTNGVTTDFDGNFSIDVTDLDATLEISYVGFATKEVAINGQTNLLISLQEGAANLDEVVVVGYGTQRKRDVTGSISSVSTEEIAQRTPANVFEAVQGQLAGVQINTGSGAPGSGASIRIRGTSTINGVPTHCTW
ncbi:Secretin and TonB N terminus short domain-containing protein [Pricia antarctica]|uniref:Secretin and TonB N terminus short domain-containing protein n=1 Tax=Pricia antarctica TaxID=641691 RepID=A0A1G7J2K3_9FLAO|nr:STN domain-containing protein [Pricia antarctica]SDF19160.1 Secretin and TonB N terminus short domain-containing protein [Pricia antarctica]